MKLHILHANGLRVATYLRGHGPTLLLMLHGFPDDAATFLGLMESLDATRYTLAAPYMRGHSPTSLARDGRYSLRALAQDALEISRSLGFERFSVLGHDLGALTAYAAAQAAPERVERLIAMSVPPPRVFLRNLLRQPAQLERSAYLAWFQVPGLGEWLLTRQDLALIERLWSTWSPAWAYSPARLKKVKATLRRRRCARAALRCYRGLALDALADSREWRRSLELALRPIRVPSLVLAGQDDGCIGPKLYQELPRAFAADARLVMLPGCGHFPHHEQPEQVRALIEAHLLTLPSTSPR